MNFLIYASFLTNTAAVSSKHRWKRRNKTGVHNFDKKDTGKLSLRRPRCRYDSDIKIYLRENSVTEMSLK
jgi:hypothetical protein